MTFRQELLKVAIGDIGLREITGPKDHPKIQLAHRVTSVCASLTDTATDVDAIPWCSSMMNLWVLQTGLRINPARVVAMLVKKRFPSDIIAAICALEKVNPTAVRPDNGVDVPEPTWSASALSWQQWEKPTIPGKEQPGDIAVFTRAGGGHVAIFLRKGWVFVTVLGANQSNMVCEADSYSRSRLVAVRRFV